MQPQPSFSVVIPLYNKIAYVADAIRSAAAQTPPPLEIIVIDDGSTDGSAELVERLQIPTVRLIRQANSGVAAARNVGVEAVRSDWISFLDADDQYLPGFLMALWKLQQAFPLAMVVATGYWRRVGTALLSNALDGTIPPLAAVIPDLYTAWNRSAFFCTISVSVSRHAFMESGLRFPTGEQFGEDQDLWFRLAERYPLAFDPIAYAEYRIDVPGSATHGRTTLNPLPCYVRLAERIANGVVPPIMQRGASRLVASHWLNIAKARLAVGDLSGAWQLIKDKRSSSNAAYRLKMACLATATRWGMAST